LIELIGEIDLSMLDGFVTAAGGSGSYVACRWQLHAT
jgi:hypothetical protein